LIRVLRQFDALVVTDECVVPDQAHAAADAHGVTAEAGILDHVVVHVDPLGAGPRSELVAVGVDRVRHLVLSNVIVSEHVSRTSVGGDCVSALSERRILHEGRAARAKGLQFQLVDPTHFDSIAQIVDHGIEQVLEGAVVYNPGARATGPDPRAAGARERAVVYSKVDGVPHTDAHLAAVGKLAADGIDVGKSLETDSGDPNLLMA
jgi:hypothetical protein